jgi:hypothetical protein
MGALADDDVIPFDARPVLLSYAKANTIVSNAPTIIPNNNCIGYVPSDKYLTWPGALGSGSLAAARAMNAAVKCFGSSRIRASFAAAHVSRTVGCQIIYRWHLGYPAYGALHGAGAGPVQGLLALVTDAKASIG